MILYIKSSPNYNITFRSPPNTLILHLKRFNHFSEKKIESEIKYPLFGLDLSPYIFVDEHDKSTQTVDGIKSNVLSPYLYDLMGAVCHRGNLNRG